MGEHASNPQRGREGQTDAENLSASLAELVDFLIGKTHSLKKVRWRIKRKTDLKQVP